MSPPASHRDGRDGSQQRPFAGSNRSSVDRHEFNETGENGKTFYLRGTWHIPLPKRWVGPDFSGLVSAQALCFGLGLFLA
jgi:hypothetical protein